MFKIANRARKEVEANLSVPGIDSMIASLKRMQENFKRETELTTDDAAFLTEYDRQLKEVQDDLDKPERLAEIGAKFRQVGISRIQQRFHARTKEELEKDDESADPIINYSTVDGE